MPIPIISDPNSEDGKNLRIGEFLVNKVKSGKLLEKHEIKTLKDLIEKYKDNFGFLTGIGEQALETNKSAEKIIRPVEILIENVLQGKKLTEQESGDLNDALLNLNKSGLSSHFNRYKVQIYGADGKLSVSEINEAREVFLEFTSQCNNLPRASSLDAQKLLDTYIKNWNEAVGRGDCSTVQKMYDQVDSKDYKRDKTLLEVLKGLEQKAIIYDVNPPPESVVQHNHRSNDESRFV